MQVEIKRICVPTDFSPAAEQAIHYGVALAELHDAALHLLHVLQDFGQAVLHPDFTAGGEQALAYFNQLEEDAPKQPGDEPKAPKPSVDETIHLFLRSLETGTDQKFEKLPLDNWWERIRILRAMRYGKPADEICRYARKQSIDLLILGTHGRTGFSQMFVGSVAERVVRISHCPVLTVRQHEHNFVVEE